jgi:hypothetical protein
MNPFYKGVFAKTAEAFGTGLAYGIVAIVVLLINKFLISPDGPLVRFSDKAEPLKSGGDNFVIYVDCNEDEIALGAMHRRRWLQWSICITEFWSFGRLN